MCSIRITSFISLITFDQNYRQEWESPGAAGDYAQMARTRVFDLAAGATRTFSLICQQDGFSPWADLHDSVLTAIFTPAP